MEAGQDCLEMACSALHLNCLFSGFELHHNQLEHLEVARDCELAIDTQHLQLTLNPTLAAKSGTLAKMQEMISQDMAISAQDKEDLKLRAP